MIIATLLSSLYLINANVTVYPPDQPPAVVAVINPSIAVIQQNHLTTSEGRRAFLTDKLLPYTAVTDQLNNEIKNDSSVISALSPKRDQQKIITLTDQMTQKMTKLINRLSVLNSVQSINEDFLQIDSILEQREPLTPAQQTVIDRIAFICNSVNAN